MWQTFQPISAEYWWGGWKIMKSSSTGKSAYKVVPPNSTWAMIMYWFTMTRTAHAVTMSMSLAQLEAPAA